MTSKLHDFKQQSGFTIVELLVATAVLSTILLIVTISIVGIGNLYYKGFNQARIQSNVRTLTDELALKLQLFDGTRFSNLAVPASPPAAVADTIIHTTCIGSTRYSYIINTQMGTTLNLGGNRDVKHVLWRDNIGTGSCTVLTGFWYTDTPSAGGTELIAPHSRLSTFAVQLVSAGQYKVSVGVAYGDGDLLCNNGSAYPGDCAAQTDDTDAAHTTALTHPAKPEDIVCRSRIGTQFCATSALQTTVVKRLN